mmetsp:Transcript_16384/g.36850  ORF Transcript_16384/g.36850 Transcript_16384/m.36850 type:complete len:81 (+) Transcript_16384:445-687(+)
MILVYAVWHIELSDENTNDKYIILHASTIVIPLSLNSGLHAVEGYENLCRLSLVKSMQKKTHSSFPLNYKPRLVDPRVNS